MQDPNEDTVWNDTLRKHGIIGEREKTEGEIALETAESVLTSAAEKVWIG